MSADDTLVKAGKLFCFSEGQYSDYGYVGHFLALQPITKALIQQTKDRCFERIKSGECEAYGMPPDLDDDGDIALAMRGLFLPELVRSGAIMDIDCTELHLGSYGRLEI